MDDITIRICRAVIIGWHYQQGEPESMTNPAVPECLDVWGILEGRPVSLTQAETRRAVEAINKQAAKEANNP